MGEGLKIRNNLEIQDIPTDLKALKRPYVVRRTFLYSCLTVGGDDECVINEAGLDLIASVGRKSRKNVYKVHPSLFLLMTADKC